SNTTGVTMDRLSLETGISFWSHLGEAIERHLLPARALAALKIFQEIIEDARAMLLGTFETRVAQDTRVAQPPPAVSSAEEDTSFDPESLGENISFDFGANEEHQDLSDKGTDSSPVPDGAM